MSFHVPSEYRVRTGVMRSDDSYGNNGAFTVPRFRRKKDKTPLAVIASDQDGWEHVSVSHAARIPKWREMCLIKSIFWDAEDAVMQLHPADSRHINNHPNCLHLWRPVDQIIPLPPDYMV